jgi:hypothetical protein
MAWAVLVPSSPCETFADAAQQAVAGQSAVRTDAEKDQVVAAIATARDLIANHLGGDVGTTYEAHLHGHVGHGSPNEQIGVSVTAHHQPVAAETSTAAV